MATTMLAATLAASSFANPSTDGRPHSILGVSVGMKLADARAILKPLGQAGGQEARAGAYREAWSLRGTDYVSIAYKANGKGRIVWLTGWLRQDKTVPFEELADTTKAVQLRDEIAIWNLSDNLRLVAKGSQRRATVIYFLEIPKSLDR